MAQIPRINQGERPSGVYSPTRDNSLAHIAGALGDLSGAALETATAKEQSERRRLAEAAALKQDLVDTSDAGVLGLQTQRRIGEISEGLKEAYKDNPKAAVDAYMDAVRPEVEVLKQQAPNPRVALMATKEAEGHIASGLTKLQSWSLSQDTARVKGNLATKEFERINAAVNYTSTVQLQNDFDTIDADPEYDTVYGAGAPEARRDIKARMARAQIERFSQSVDPVQARAMLADGKGFYGKYLKDTDLTALYNGTEADAFNFANRDELNTVVKYSKSKAVLVQAALRGLADVADFSSEERKINTAIEGVPNERGLTKEAKAKKIARLNLELSDLKAIKVLQSRNLDQHYVAIGDTPSEVWTARRDLLDMGDAGDAATLDAVMNYERLIMKASGDKKMSPGRATTLMQEAEILKKEALGRATGDTGKFYSRNDLQTGELAIEQEVSWATNGRGLPPEIRGKVTEKFVSDYLDAISATGKRPDTEEIKKIARRAYYKVRKIGVPQGLE